MNRTTTTQLGPCCLRLPAPGVSTDAASLRQSDEILTHRGHELMLSGIGFRQSGGPKAEAQSGGPKRRPKAEAKESHFVMDAAV
jgi:hypothetical protein